MSPPEHFHDKLASEQYSTTVLCVYCCNGSINNEFQTAVFGKHKYIHMTA